MRLKVTGVRKLFSGIASCRRISRNSIRAMKRKPRAAADQDPADVLVVGAGDDLDPARTAAAGKPSTTSSGVVLTHGTSPFSIRPTTRSWAACDVGFLALDEGFVGLRRDDVDLGPHRRVGLAGEGRGLTVEVAFFVGAEDDVVDLAGDGVALAGASSGTSQVWIDVGRDQVRVRPRCRPGRPACNRRRPRLGSRSATATAGRSLRSSAAPSSPRRGRPAPVVGVSRALSVKTMLSTKMTAAKTVSTAPTRNWMPRPPRIWRGSAPRSLR